MKPHHFAKTLENIEMFARIKTQMDSKISFGIGFLTSQETREDMEIFVKLIKDITKRQKGIDCVQFRPFTGDTFDIVLIFLELQNKY